MSQLEWTSKFFITVGYFVLNLITHSNGTVDNFTYVIDYSAVANDSVHSDALVLSDEARLMNYLASRHALYGKVARPVRNSTKSVRVGFSLALFQILNLDEKSQSLKTKTWKGYWWTDEFLVWNPAEFGGLTRVQVPVESVWYPDIVLYNNADSEPVPASRNVMPVTNEGLANWVLPVIYTSTCEIDMTLFPFDIQTCQFTFASWSYDLLKLNLDFYSDSREFDMSSYLPSSEWDVVSTEASRKISKYNNGTVSWPELNFKLTIRRRIGFYVYVLIVPSLVLSFLTPGLFWIPPSRPDRTTLGMSLFSSFFVLLLVLVQSSPSSASVSKLGIYCCINMALIALSTMLSAFVIYISHNYREQPVPPWIRLIFIKLLAVILLNRLERRCEDVIPLDSVSAQINKTVGGNATTSSSGDVISNQIAWHTIAAVMDRTFFITSVSLICIAIAVVFPR